MAWPLVVADANVRVSVAAPAARSGDAEPARSERGVGRCDGVGRLSRRVGFGSGAATSESDRQRGDGPVGPPDHKGPADGIW